MTTYTRNISPVLCFLPLLFTHIHVNSYIPKCLSAGIFFSYLFPLFIYLLGETFMCLSPIKASSKVKSETDNYIFNKPYKKVPSNCQRSR